MTKEGELPVRTIMQVIHNHKTRHNLTREMVKTFLIWWTMVKIPIWAGLAD